MTNVGYKRLAFCTRVKFLQVTKGFVPEGYMGVEHGMIGKGGNLGGFVGIDCLRIEIPVSSQESHRGALT